VVSKPGRLCPALSDPSTIAKWQTAKSELNAEYQLVRDMSTELGSFKVCGMHVNIARASCVTARRLNVLPLQDPPGLLARRDDRSFSAGAPWDERQHLTPGDSPDRVAASDSYQQHVGMAPAQVRRAPAATTVASHKVSAGSVAKPSNKLPLWAQRPAADEKQDEDSPRDDAGAVPRLFEFSKFCMLTGSLNGFLAGSRYRPPTSSAPRKPSVPTNVGVSSRAGSVVSSSAASSSRTTGSRQMRSVSGAAASSSSSSKYGKNTADKAAAGKGGKKESNERPR